ncbi:phage minor tail protein L [Corallococcus sp. CA047B]|nr:phage minor tail protein L [Corallococcus sp. CA047B]
MAYQHWAVQAKGFDKSGMGRLPRPTLALANVACTIGAMARDFNDLQGARVLRKRTFVRYLDAVNFPGGANPTASLLDAFTDDEFVVDQKTTENKHITEFSLAAWCELNGVRIPLRVITQMRAGSTGARAAATLGPRRRSWTTRPRPALRRTAAGNASRAASFAPGDGGAPVRGLPGGRAHPVISLIEASGRYRMVGIRRFPSAG